MSAELTPLMVYPTSVPFETSVVTRLTLKVSPSFTELELAVIEYVGFKLVSLIGMVIASSPLSKENTRFSAPSVVASEEIIMSTLSVVPVTKLPVKLAPFISALFTPEIV